MPLESSELRQDAQIDWSGGANMIATPGENQYRWAKNITVRTGKPTTRPGVRTVFRSTSEGFQTAFYFNADNAKFNDSTHTGFWFPFDFIGSIWGTIQGMGTIQFAGETEPRLLVVAGGNVYAHRAGYVDKIDTVENIGADENIFFVQANQLVLMFRGEGNNPMQWDGGAGGFVLVPDPATGQKIVSAANASYMAGRLWIPRDRDNIYVSDILDFSRYDYVYQLFGVSVGDGDEITRIVEFHEDIALVFKKRKIYYMSGINAAVFPGTHLSDYVKIGAVDTQHGLVAEHAWVMFGEQFAFLSFGGIYTFERNNEGRLYGMDVPLSAPIQPMIDRINWDAVGCACATNWNNYLIFAVPMDGATYNNKLLVYDLLHKSWIPEWESQMIRPVQFVKVDDKQYFLNNDGRLKMIGSDDPWDTEDPFGDVRIYEPDVYYEEGQYCQYTPQGEEKTIYRAVQGGVGHLPTDTDYWEAVTDPYNLFRIESELWSRWYDLGDETTGKRFQRVEVTVAHQNPKLTVQVENRDYATVKTVVQDKEYDRTKYDVMGRADWVPTNENDDWATPHRQDYSVFFDNSVPSGYASPVMIYTLSGFTFDAPASALDCNGVYEFSAWQQLTDPAGVTRNHPIYVLSTNAEWRIRQYGWTGVTAGTIPVWRIEHKPSYLNDWFTSFTITSWATLSSNDVWTPSNVLYHAGAASVAENPSFAYPGQGLYINETTGIFLNVYTRHSIRFYPMLAGTRSFSLRLTNTQGKMSIESVRQSGVANRFALRGKVL